MKKLLTNQRFKFQSTDSVITSLVALSSEPTLRYELTFSGSLDTRRLQAALKALVEFEPVLACKLVLDDHPYFELQELEDKDILVITESQDEFDRFRETKIDIEQGPLVACALLKGPEGDKLLFKFAHEAADGFGIAEAVSFVALHYRDPAAANARIRKPHELSRSPVRLIKQFGVLDYPKLSWLNAKEKLGYFLPAGTMAYSCGEKGLVKSSFLTREIDTATVKAMRDYAKKQGATLNDLLLATFLRAMAHKVDFKGDKALRILLTINLRRYLKQSPVPSSEICNLSAMECVNIGRELGQALPDTLKKVAHVTQQKKQAGIGLSFLLDLIVNEKLKYTTQKKINQSTRDMVMKTENFAVTVTNVGEISAATLTFDNAPKDVQVFAPLAYAPFWCFSVYEYAGVVKIGCAIDSRRAQLFNDLLDAVEKEIAVALNNAGFQILK